MTLFSIISALLLVVAVLFVVLPLWRSRIKSDQVLRNSANLEIFRDQVAEMDTDLRNGLLTQELYDQGKRELQSRLLEEVNNPEAAAQPIRRNPHKFLALVLAVALPSLAIGLYWKIGNRDALLPSGSISGQGAGAGQADATLKNLQDKLTVNPKDTDSLEALARLYASMGRYSDSAMTYNKLTKLIPQNAQLWADFADSLAMASGQKLAGHPTMLIKTALSLDPNNPKALALAGSAAMEVGDYAQAIQHWEKLLTIIPNDTEDAKMFADGIQQARAAMAGKGGKPMAQGEVAGQAASGQERITGTVTISAAMKGKVGPDDMLYVLARAESGPPMPLAVMRKQVKDLPLKFELNDSMAMAPQMKLSNFDKVVVVARVAKSGDPMPHPGDIQGQSATIKPGASGIKVSIDSVVN